MKRPWISVVRWRETCVSVDTASTVASAIGSPSGPVTLPVMMSVVLPTCAAAG